MGECGCGSSGKHYRFPAPNGGTYVIQLQPTCRYCGGPFGVVVHRYSEERAKDEEVDASVEALAFVDYGYGHAEGCVMVIDPAEARQCVATYLVQTKLAADEIEAEAHAEEIIDECIAPLLFKQPERK